MQKFQINKEFITLGQLLQANDIIQSGGAAKWFLQEYVVYVNDETENRRGRKLYPGDQVEIPAFKVKFLIESRP